MCKHSAAFKNISICLLHCSFNDKYFDKLFLFLIKFCDEKLNYEDTTGMISNKRILLNL